MDKEKKMAVLENLKYSKTHEWALIEGDTAVIGITDYAQDQLGDIVFLEVPEVGSSVTKNEEFGSVESVKSVSELISPVSGEVIEVNEPVKEAPETINSDAFQNWMIKVKLSNPSEIDELMSAQEYEKFIAEEG